MPFIPQDNVKIFDTALPEPVDDVNESVICGSKSEASHLDNQHNITFLLTSNSDTNNVSRVKFRSCRLWLKWWENKNNENINYKNNNNNKNENNNKINTHGGPKFDDLNHLKFNSRVDSGGRFFNFIIFKLVNSSFIIHFVHDKCFDVRNRKSKLSYGGFAKDYDRSKFINDLLNHKLGVLDVNRDFIKGNINELPPFIDKGIDLFILHMIINLNLKIIVLIFWKHFLILLILSRGRWNLTLLFWAQNCLDIPMNNSKKNLGIFRRNF